MSEPMRIRAQAAGGNAIVRRRVESQLAQAHSARQGIESQLRGLGGL